MCRKVQLSWTLKMLVLLCSIWWKCVQIYSCSKLWNMQYMYQNNIIIYGIDFAIMDASMLWFTQHIMQKRCSKYHSVIGSDPACLAVSCSLTLSICLSAFTLSFVWSSICSNRQSILLVFDSWWVILSVFFSDVIQVQCARAKSPGVTVSCFCACFFFCR